MYFSQTLLENLKIDMIGIAIVLTIRLTHLSAQMLNTVVMYMFLVREIEIPKKEQKIVASC